MNVDQLIDTYPTLHHMAEAGSWDKIQQIGLCTTKQLVAACAPSPELRAEILDGQRKKSYTLEHPVVGAVTIRDQQPLKMHNLRPKLSGITLEGFLGALNDRVFFWAHLSRLEGLLNAKLYRESRHDVLVVDTAKLVEQCEARIRLASINTGATIFPNTAVRDAATFQAIPDFVFGPSRSGRSSIGNVVEVCVLDGVSNPLDCVTRVESRLGDSVVRVLYEA
jgi:hypothetical protein